MDITLIPAKNSLLFRKIRSKSELKENEILDGFLIDSDEKEIRRILDALKSRKENKLIAVSGKDDDFNRRAVETLKINYLVSPEKFGKDTLKQRGSGINHYLAKAAAKNNIAFVINFSELEFLEKKQKAILIARIIQNIKICRKAKCKIKVASFAENKNQLADEYSLKAFFSSLGASSQQASEATKLI